MNFDEMKSAWQQDAGDHIQLPDNMEQIKRATSPIEKVKKIIRMEMWLNVFFLIFFFSLPLITDRLTSHSQVFYYTLLFMTLMPMSYCFSHFYKFYGRLNSLELTTKETIDEVYLDFRHHISMYRIMHHFITPNFFLIGFVIGIGPKIDRLFNILATIKDLEKTGLITGCIGILILLLLTVGFYYFIRWAVHYSYGRYLKELGEIRKSLIDA